MAKPKQAGRPKTKHHVESEGIAHIKATFDNTLVSITDMAGNSVVWGSAGKAGFKGSKKSTPFAATVAAEQAAREALQMGVKRVHVYVQGPGSGRESAIQALAASGLGIRSIRDVEIRELQPAHKSDKVTVGEAARAFRKVQGGSGKRVVSGERYVRRDENGRFTGE